MVQFLINKFFWPGQIKNSGKSYHTKDKNRLPGTSKTTQINGQALVRRFGEGAQRILIAQQQRPNWQSVYNGTSSLLFRSQLVTDFSLDFFSN